PPPGPSRAAVGAAARARLHTRCAAARPGTAGRTARGRPGRRHAGEVRDVQREGALRREGAPRGGVHGRPPGEHVHQRAALRVAAAVVLAHSARAVAASGREGPPGDPHGGGPVLGGRRRCSPLDP
ncbi:unnamed protein product, partial [Prorocentrum cordatum]